MKSINTVTGSIDVNELKFTLMHEHLLLSDWNLRLADPEFLNLDQAIPMIEEVITDAKAHGEQSSMLHLSMMAVMFC